MAKTTATVLPKIATTGMPGFLLWMRRDNPRAYKKLAQDIPAVSAFEEQLQSYVDPAALVPGMSGVVYDKPALDADQDDWFLDPASVLQGFDAAEVVSGVEDEYGNGMGDISDVFSSIGGALSSAASSVGSWLGANAGTLITAGTSLALVAKQNQLAQTQLQLAQAGQPPAQTAIAYTAQGQPYYVPVQRTGIQQGYSSGLQTYPTLRTAAASAAPLGVPLWVWAAGVAGVGLLFLLRRR